MKVPGIPGVLSIVLYAASEAMKAASEVLLDEAENLERLDNGRVNLGSLIIVTRQCMERNQKNWFELGRDSGALEVSEKFGLPALPDPTRRLNPV